MMNELITADLQVFVARCHVHRTYIHHVQSACLNLLIYFNNNKQAGDFLPTTEVWFGLCL